MRLKHILKFALAFCFMAGPVVLAQRDCFPKKSDQLVNDYVGVITQSQRNSLENKLEGFARSTSTQIAIVIVKDLCGYDKAGYTIQLANDWGVGQKGKDNGVMIMVKPTGGAGQRHVFIATGYGLEGVIPDAVAKRIVEKEMIPRFKNNDIYGGLDVATNILMKLASGEFKASEYKAVASNPGIFPFFFILFVFLIILFSKYFSVRRYSRTNHISFWAAMALLNASTRRSGGSYGGFSSGGGFGGGSFGGGGAGGSW